MWDTDADKKAPADAAENKNAPCSTSAQKPLWMLKCKQESKRTDLLPSWQNLLSLSVPCGLLPRTQTSPRPSYPMVQLIICSAVRKLMLSYASLCLHNWKVSRLELQLGRGVRQAGLASETLAWIWRWVNLSEPFKPFAVFILVSRSSCEATDPTDCVDRSPADQHKKWH